ncbi:MAG: GDSL-type esterase/lipase family protein [Ferruginibacter sp.]
MMIKYFFPFAFILLFAFNAPSQQITLPYWNDVQAFKKQDSSRFPPPGQVLFIGSSSFTLWKNVDTYFPGYKILNRAFGGSTLEDLIRYRYDVIYPYQPKQIVMYCGENDFANNDTLSVAAVVERFKTLYGFIRAKYPSTSFVYVSMKPSPSRKHLMPKYKEANILIEKFLQASKNNRFVDAFHHMLKPDGSPMDDIFLDDWLHMNAKGYAIWKKLLQPVLKK